MDREKIVEKFREVKNLGFVKSNRANNTGIGKTFEDYMGIVENNIKGPDLFGYEIKSQREQAQSYVTLFTKSPTHPGGANTILRDSYGSPYKDNPNLKKIHTSMFAGKFNSYESRLAFKLINDKKSKIIRIGVYTHPNHQLVYDSVYYTYDVIEKTLKKKLHSLFFVNADTRKNGNGEEEFHFTEAEIYESPTLAKFLELLDAGKIMFDIRIGSYKTPTARNYGKTHDHGSGFRIKAADLCDLYSVHETVV